jgi:hypothetical protein
MKLCNNGHKAIAYEGENCPVCDLLQECDRYQRQIESMKPINPFDMAVEVTRGYAEALKIMGGNV